MYIIFFVFESVAFLALLFHIHIVIKIFSKNRAHIIITMFAPSLKLECSTVVSCVLFIRMTKTSEENSRNSRVKREQMTSTHGGLSAWLIGFYQTILYSIQQ